MPGRKWRSSQSEPQVGQDKARSPKKVLLHIHYGITGEVPRRRSSQEGRRGRPAVQTRRVAPGRTAADAGAQPAGSRSRLCDAQCEPAGAFVKYELHDEDLTKKKDIFLWGGGGT